MIRMVCLVLLATASVNAQSAAKIISDIQAEIADARKELQKSREQLQKSREQLQAQVAGVEKRIAATDRELAEIETEQKLLLKQLTDVRSEARQKELALRRCQDALTANRKDCQSFILRTQVDKGQFSRIDKLLSEDPNRLTDQSKELFIIYQDGIAKACQVELTKSTAVDTNGLEREGSVLRLGGFGALFSSGPYDGIGTPKGGSSEYHLAPGRLSGEHRLALRDACSSTTGAKLVPIDISDGKALSGLQTRRGLIEFCQAAGPVAIPLAIVAVLAVIMVLERSFFLSRVDGDVDRLLDRVLPYLRKGDFKGALEQIRGRGPVFTVIRTGVEQGPKNSERLEQILQESILAELPALERFLGALAVMAAIAPLLGLLGTVSGMISTFQIITVYGTGNAKLLSGGISEALITTEIGLIVAVPILLAHSWLSRQVRTIIGHMDRAAISLVATIREREDNV